MKTVNWMRWGALVLVCLALVLVCLALGCLALHGCGGGGSDETGGVAALGPASEPSPPPALQPPPLLMRLRAGEEGGQSRAAVAAGVAQAHGFHVDLSIEALRVYRLVWNDGAKPGQFAAQRAALARHPAVEYIEADGRVKADLTPTDPLFGQQWALPKIKAPEAWERDQGQGIVMADVDTGVDRSHMEFAGEDKFVPGYDFVNQDPEPDDDHSHGTHVAGILSASLNAKGIVGVAPRARIMPVKVLDAEGWGFASTVAAGILWAVEHGARAINLSLGGNADNQTLRLACEEAIRRGVVLVAAAGNDGNSRPHYPSAYPGVISVASTNRSDAKSSWSNFGPSVTIAAPGEAVISTIRGNKYAVWSGTSMAAPHVTGMVALTLALRPDWTPQQVRAILVQATDDIGHKGEYWESGRINLLRLVDLLNPTLPPTVSSIAPDTASSSRVKATRVIITGTGYQAGPPRPTAQLIPNSGEHLCYEMTTTGFLPWIRKHK